MLAALLQPYSDKPLKPSDFLPSEQPSPSPAELSRFASVLTGQPPDIGADVERAVASGQVTFKKPPDA